MPRNADGRKKEIIRAGLIGILVNILLAVFKAVVGVLSHSIAVVLDAVNNATDVLSSVVTVVGARLAGRPADREHPLGHGRIEYLSAQIVAAVILYAGITSIVESVKRIIHPVLPDFRAVTLTVIGVSIAVKLVLGIYYLKRGKALNSDALVNSGKDALSDMVISAATLAAAVIFMLAGVNIEAWLGVAIALVIIHASIRMYRETGSKIVGERVDSELSLAVKQTICETEGVSGAYDLILNSYGPDRWVGSVNIEVPADWTADKIDIVSREISERVTDKYGIKLSSLGVHTRGGNSVLPRDLRRQLKAAVLSEEYVTQLHGLGADTEAKKLRFDIVIDFKAPDPAEVCRRVKQRAEEVMPGYEVSVQYDSDYSD
ncbi:MAG: cation transporter [Clostridia bacterium]|nr:cation transporter [Clostridia bacterium]